MRKALFLIVIVAYSGYGQEIISPIRVHAGLSPFTDVAGQQWSLDTGYAVGPSTITIATGPVANAINQGLYLSQRTSCNSLAYSVTLPNNRYRVMLKFSELSTAARTFDIALNGAVVTPAFSTGTPYSAIDKVYYATVTSGALAILLTGKGNNPCPVLDAFEIVPSVPIAEQDVSLLTLDLSRRVTMGPAFAAPGVAVINDNGQLDAAVGPPDGCLLLDGTAKPCNFVDGETPSGAVDGTNTLFTLSSTPYPSTSLILTRNGLVMKQALDYTLTDVKVTFLTGAVPQIGDVLLTWYRF